MLFSQLGSISRMPLYKCLVTRELIFYKSKSIITKCTKMSTTYADYLSSARIWRKSLWSVWSTTGALTKFSSELSCCPRWRGWPTTAHLWLNVFTHTPEPTNVACIHTDKMISFLADTNIQTIMVLSYYLKLLNSSSNLQCVDITEQVIVISSCEL
jgi:hypothetical protein